MCITITLLCRITYDNKMTVRKHNVERNWRKIYMEKERENSTTSATSLLAGECKSVQFEVSERVDWP